MAVWVYLFDEFRPVEVDDAVVLEMAGRNPAALFDVIRHVVEESVGGIGSVRLFDIYSDPQGAGLLVEYLVETRIGEISVKLIRSPAPAETLAKYYANERNR